MEKVFLRFSTNNTIVSRIVRFFTWSEYSHVDYILDSGLYLGSLPKCGVHIHRKKFKKELIVCVEVDNKQDIEDFLMNQLGKEYDISAILAMPLRKNWQDPSKWFCSELIAASFKNSNINLVNDSLHRVTPRDLLISSSIKYT